jgi:orotidine-5'-phosphate decarboxylase
MAAIGTLGVLATTVNPAGGRRTVSPWLTQARSCAERPSKIPARSAISTVAGPYSRFPSATTSPPRTCAMSCMP